MCLVCHGLMADEEEKVANPSKKKSKMRSLACTSGYLTPAFSEVQKRAELLCNPYVLGGSQRQAREENQNWLPHPCLLGGPKQGGIAM